MRPARVQPGGDGGHFAVTARGDLIRNKRRDQASGLAARFTGSGGSLELHKARVLRHECQNAGAAP